MRKRLEFLKRYALSVDEHHPRQSPTRSAKHTLKRPVEQDENPFLSNYLTPEVRSKKQLQQESSTSANVTSSQAGGTAALSVLIEEELILRELLRRVTNSQRVGSVC